MKIKVWYIAKDDDDGTDAEVFGTEAEMETALWEWFSEMMKATATAPPKSSSRNSRAMWAKPMKARSPN
jgi:hypothetical protein